MSTSLLKVLIRDLLFEQIRKKFKMDLPQDLVLLADQFKIAGYPLYVVGGAVRDALMGKEPKDYDVATGAVPDKVAEILATNPENKVLEIGKAFGVVKVITPLGNEYEIATFRRDLSGGRRPDAVEFSNIETDVMRRDLTINALFYDIDAEEIVDFVGGIDDIEKGIVKAVGDPIERFNEDRLRILRAIRFAGRSGSQLDPATSNAIKQDNSLKGVSPERIRDEFLKGIKSAKSVPQFLGMINEYDLWSQIFQGLIISYDQIETKNIPIVLARLLWENDPQIVLKKLNTLKFLSNECAQVSFLLRFKGLVPENAYKLKKAFVNSKLSDEDLIEFAVMKNMPSQQLTAAFIEYEPSISGQDLIALGFTGANLGNELEHRETVLFKQILEAQ